MQLEPRSLNSVFIGNVVGAKRKSQALPLPRSHISRTESEIQLEDDQAEAEWRDYCMFQRIVMGITKKQNKMYETLCSQSARVPQEEDRPDISVNEAIARNQKCLEHIVHTQRMSLCEDPVRLTSRRCYLQPTMVDEKNSIDYCIIACGNVGHEMSTPSNIRKVSSDENHHFEKQEFDCSEQDFFLFEL